MAVVVRVVFVRSRKKRWRGVWRREELRVLVALRGFRGDFRPLVWCFKERRLKEFLCCSVVRSWKIVRGLVW